VVSGSIPGDAEFSLSARPCGCTTVRDLEPLRSTPVRIGQSLRDEALQTAALGEPEHILRGRDEAFWRGAERVGDTAAPD
jgi:hypothetical protein